MANQTVVSHGRREVVITERAGKFKLEFFLRFDDDDGYRESVGGALEHTLTAAMKKAQAWTGCLSVPTVPAWSA